MAAVEEALPDACDAAAVSPAAPAAAATELDAAGPSPLQRAKNKVAAHVSAVSSLLAEHQGDAQVVFADAAIRSLNELLNGRCVPSTEISRLRRLSAAFSRDGQAGLRALSLMGESLLSTCIASNHQLSLAYGLEPDEYGLPRTKVQPPKYDEESLRASNHRLSLACGLEPDEYGLPRTKVQPPKYDEESLRASNHRLSLACGLQPDEYGLPRLRMSAPKYMERDGEFVANYSPDGMPSRALQQRLLKVHEMQQRQLQQQWEVKEEPLWDGETRMEEAIECMTRGYLRGPTGTVDLSRVPPMERDEEEEYEGRRPMRREERKIKQYPITASPPPFEYKTDAAGNVLVKSEMLGEEEFFDYQAQQRVLFHKYEDIAKTGVEERHIRSQMMGKGSRKKGEKIYDCKQCDEVGFTQGKFSAHMRIRHPKSPTVLAEAREEKRAKAAAAAAQLAQEGGGVEGRQKRTRRAPPARDEMVSHSGNTPPAPAPAPPVESPAETPEETPAPKKLYTCPMCAKVLTSQHAYGAHMRYIHPKESPMDDMKGRRASVSTAQMGSSAVASGSKMTSSASSSSKMAAVCTYTNGAALTETPKTREEGGGGDRQFSCSLCGRIFSSRLQLGGHTGHCRVRAAKEGAASTSMPELSTPKLTASAGKKAEKVTPSGSASTSKMTSSGQKKEKEVKEEDEEGTPKKTYKCSICSRVFDNNNGMAGHTRHCRAGHNVTAPPASPVFATPALPAVTSASKVTPSDFVSPLAPSPRLAEVSKMTPTDASPASPMPVLPPYSPSVTTSVERGTLKPPSLTKRKQMTPSASTPSKTTPSSVQNSAQKTSSTKKRTGAAKAEESSGEEGEETEKKSYKCNICARPFPTYFGMAGHTRHCAEKNDVPPSRRSLERRAEKEKEREKIRQADAAAALIEKDLAEEEEDAKMSPNGRMVKKKKALPISPLALPPRQPAGSEKKESGEEKEEEGEKETPKPIQRKRRPTAVVKYKESTDEEEGGGDGEGWEKRPITGTSKRGRKEAAAVSPLAAEAATPIMARGKVVGPLTMSTRRAARAQTSTGTPQSDASSPVTPPQPDPISALADRNYTPGDRVISPETATAHAATMAARAAAVAVDPAYAECPGDVAEFALAAAVAAAAAAPPKRVPRSNAPRSRVRGRTSAVVTEVKEEAMDEEEEKVPLPKRARRSNPARPRVRPVVEEVKEEGVDEEEQGEDEERKKKKKEKEVKEEPVEEEDCPSPEV